MPLPEEDRPYAGLWGTIQAATAVRASTAEVFAAARTEAARIGVTLGQGAFAAIGRMRGIAASVRNAAQTFQRADTAAEFTWKHAAPDINIRSAAQRDVMPEYLVRFDLTYVDPAGNEVTQTVSVRDILRPDMTVGDVHDSVWEAAEGLANSYGQGLVGVDNLRPVII